MYLEMINGFFCMRQKKLIVKILQSHAKEPMIISKYLPVVSSRFHMYYGPIYVLIFGGENYLDHLELMCISTSEAFFYSFIQEEIQEVNNSLQDSCTPLMTKGEELVRCRRIQRNIAAAIENLNLCLPVLEMYGKLQDQMKTKRYLL